MSKRTARILGPFQPQWINYTALATLSLGVFTLLRGK
jgi:hypothetical protein